MPISTISCRLSPLVWGCRDHNPRRQRPLPGLLRQPFLRKALVKRARLTANVSISSPGRSSRCPSCTDRPSPQQLPHLPPLRSMHPSQGNRSMHQPPPPPPASHNMHQHPASPNTQPRLPPDSRSMHQRKSSRSMHQHPDSRCRFPPPGRYNLSIRLSQPNRSRWPPCRPRNPCNLPNHSRQLL